MVNPQLHSFVAPPVWVDWWGRAQWDRRNCWAKLNINLQQWIEVGVWVINIFGKKNPFFKWIDWSLKKLWNTIRAQSISAWSLCPLRSSAAATVYTSCPAFTSFTVQILFIFKKRQSNPWKSAKNAKKLMFCTPTPTLLVYNPVEVATLQPKSSQWKE